MVSLWSIDARRRRERGEGEGAGREEGVDGYKDVLRLEFWVSNVSGPSFVSLFFSHLVGQHTRQLPESAVWTGIFGHPDCGQSYILYHGLSRLGQVL